MSCHLRRLGIEVLLEVHVKSVLLLLDAFEGVGVMQQVWDELTYIDVEPVTVKPVREIPETVILKLCDTFVNILCDAVIVHDPLVE